MKGCIYSAEGPQRPNQISISVHTEWFWWIIFIPLIVAICLSIQRWSHLSTEVGDYNNSASLTADITQRWVVQANARKEEKTNK